ncbi:MAG: hypothetical protein HOW97_39810 [Catenulispora sp.]|uniref:hypothetical protein n=1 Tax=Kitasatospora sp. NPDC056531 TaxID=3345856 RepID=UPI0018066917|nr:hypothetical protein [Catenulispora sp.]
MSADAGPSVQAGGRVELGQCRFCGAWTYGPWVEDLTAHIAIVEHCPDPDGDQDDEPF